MRYVRKTMRVARPQRCIPELSKTTPFEEYVKRFDKISGLKPVTYTFGEKK